MKPKTYTFEVLIAVIKDDHTWEGEHMAVECLSALPGTVMSSAEIDAWKAYTEPTGRLDRDGEPVKRFKKGIVGFKILGAKRISQ